VVLTLPTTTRAAVFHGPDDIRLERVPLAAPAAGQVLVRIRACGLCSSETLAWYMQRKAPVPLGHEPVGEVVAAGPGAAVRAGQRAFVHHHGPCLQCRACRREDYVHCRTWRASRLVPGGLAEFALVPAEIAATDLLPLLPEVNDEAAVFVEPLACVVKSLRRARLRPGDRIAVIGLGVMGLLHLALARQATPERLVGVDLLPARLAAARGFGAEAVAHAGENTAAAVREATVGGADVVFVTPASLEAVRLGYECLAAGGRLVLFTPLAPEVTWPLPVHDVFFREIEIVPTYSAGPNDTREALRLLTQGLAVEGLITHRFDLEGAAEGYRLVARGEALKVVVHP
jgi:L-iditol 2-dehydrogenase